MRRFLALTLALHPALLGAQLTVRTDDARAGTEATRYLRARLIDTASAGPWLVSHEEAPRLRGLRADIGSNTGFPFGRDDGSAWAGRGVNARLTGTASYRWGPLSARLAPLLWWTQNADFTLIPLVAHSPAAPTPFPDPQRPRAIDLPQRFGTDPVARLDPGESEVALDVWRFRAAVTSGARHLGAGTHHSLIMQADGGGFPRLELGVPLGVRTPIGTFAGVLASGRIAQTVWAPQRREGARHGSFIEGRWKPFNNDRVEIGAARFYHRDWLGLRAKDVLVPFGSFYFDDQIFGDGDADNQLAMLFGSLRVPEFGIELFGEFGKNDRNADTRDLAVQFEHNAAWLVGLQKVWRDDQDRLWALNATGASAKVASLIRFRPQASFYQHFPIRQGHTNRGQLLGTPLLERDSGVELRLDRYDPQGRVGLILGTRYLPNERDEFVDDYLLRQEWSALIELLRDHPRGQWFARIGAIADLNRHPTLGDAYGATVSLGFILKP